MSQVDVGAVDEFPEKTMRIVEADGFELGVCRWGDEIFAVRNQCPHQGAPLCAGFLQSALTARCVQDGVELEAEAGEPVILCSWHRWEFSMRTGQSVWDPNYRVKRYPVTVADGRVLVEVRRSRRGVAA